MNEETPQPTAIDIDEVEAHPEMQQALKHAFTLADNDFANHMRKHWNVLGASMVKERLTEQSDIPMIGFSRRHLLNTLKESRQRLERVMGEVASADQFADACQDFIDAEMNHLFFVTNNRVEANIVREYFERFVTTAVHSMQVSGRMSAEGEALPHSLSDYYDIGFASYEDLRDIVHNETNGATHSLVFLALSQSADESNGHGLVKLPRLAEQSEAARDMVVAATQKTMTDMIGRHFRLDPLQDRMMDYTTPWVAMRAREISLAQTEQLESDHFSMRKALQETKDALRMESVLMAKVGALFEEHGPIYGLLDAQKMFQEFHAEANAVPEHFDDMLGDALENAKVAAQTQYPDRFKQHAQRRDTGPVPRSAKLVHSMAPAAGTMGHGQHTNEELGQLLVEALKGATSLRRLTRDAEEFIDNLGERVAFGVVEPSVLLYAQNFMASLRRELGNGLHDAGMFDLKGIALIKDVEDKCGNYYESHHVLREWTMRYTHGAYDRPLWPVYVRYAHETGAHFEDIPEAVFEGELMPQAKAEMGKMLRDMGLNRRDYHHAMMPLLVDKASAVAAGVVQHSGLENDDERLAQTMAQTKAILEEAVKRLPKRDSLTGAKYTRQPFKARDVSGLITYLDRHVSMLTPQGRA